MTLKHRFGIDIDGTVTCPATLIPHINQQYNINMTLQDITEYDFLSGFPYPVDPLEFQTWFKENEPYMYQVSELAPYAQQVNKTHNTRLATFCKNPNMLIAANFVTRCKRAPIANSDKTIAIMIVTSYSHPNFRNT